MPDLEAGLPPLYARWMKKFFGGPVPSESRATCDDCPMIREEGSASEVRFDPRTKCCTFFPELPSFQVGLLIRDDDPALREGRDRVLARIADGQQVTPLGIGRPAIYYKIYGHDSTFGVATALRCPYHLADGRCGVWRYRESTCATWYCKHDRGRVGFSTWRAVRRLLKAIEQRLTYLVAVDLGIHPDAANALFTTTYTLSKELEPDYFRAIWGPWAGREVEYYQACAAAVTDLDWDAVRRRCGDALDDFVDEARAAKARLDQPLELPELVRIRSLRRVRSEERQTVLATYSAFDALAVPHRTALALLDVTGEPDTITARLKEQGVDRALLERLLDLGLLEDGKL